MIILSSVTAVLALSVFGFAQVKSQQSQPNPFEVTTLTAPDGSISADFVPFGATMMKLLVKDKAGKFRDVILGYDDPSLLLKDPNHPVFNAIVGRYANRIKNGTFSIPISKNPVPGPNTYHVPTNDHDGQVTLHGGIYGWDRRNWTLAARTRSSVTYKHIDRADEGFPGTVTVFATHSLSNGGVLKTDIHATATEKTPIMLTQHIYWNLDAFQGNLSTVLNHHLQVRADKVIELNELAIPTGKFIPVNGTPFDFNKEHALAERWNSTVDLCGTGCQGYDNCWVYDKNRPKALPATSAWSKESGIKVDMYTNQPAVQIYSSFWMNNPRKVAHGGPDVNYGRWSGLAIEQQGEVAAINTPEWGVDQIYSPTRPYDWSTTYKFSTV